VTAVDAGGKSRGSLFRTALRWAVGVVAVTFVIWVLPIKDRCTDAGCQDGLITTFRHTNIPMLAAVCALYMLGTVAWAARWRALLGPADAAPSLGATWRVTIEAQAGGILLPGGMGGDALRIAYAKERTSGASIAKIVASTLADRIVGLSTLSTLAVVLAAIFDTGGDLHVAMPMLVGIPVVTAAGWIALRRLSSMGKVRDLRLLKNKYGEKLVLPMLEYAASPRGPRAIAYGVLMSFLVSGSQLLVVRGLVSTVGSSPSSEGWVYAGSAFVMIIGSLPLAPGGWGTTDAAFVFFLGRAGVAPGAAAAVCLLYRMMWYGTGFLGAGSAFARGTVTK
jgi:uncharacterized protein (TIRG00374 family)